MTDATSAPRPIITAYLIVERDDGRFAIGLHDDAPGFETRGAAIAAFSIIKGRLARDHAKQHGSQSAARREQPRS